MTPLKLTIQAFGPFANQQVIDFTELGQSPLFLINGPTGSGKSSILDAICFALYGETTGSERTGEQMRCDHAPADLPTEVVFEFSLGSKHYRIERSPTQMLPKKRGDGLTKKEHSAVLFAMEEGQEQLLANKPQPVAKAISELIGLDVKQFRQVMVLPQGKFRELLIANSKEREQIFGQLFQTHIYVAIERALFDKAAHIRRAKDEFDNQIKGALDVAGVESEEQLNAAIDQLTPELSASQVQLQNAQQALEVAQTQHKSATELVAKFARHDQLVAERTVHVAQQAEMDALVTKKKRAQLADGIRNAHTQWNTAKQKHQQLQTVVADNLTQVEQVSAQFQQNEQAYLEANQSAQIIPELNKKLFELNEIAKRLIQRDQMQAELVNARQHQQQIAHTHQHATRQLTALEEGYRTQQTQLQQIKEALAGLPAKQAQLKQIQSLIHYQQELVKTEQAAEQFRAIFQTRQSEYQQAQSVYEQAKQFADQQEYLWHSSQAAQLAKTLRIGEPCPVCGSKDHPQPASFTQQEVTKEQVEQARGHQAQTLKLQETAYQALQQAEAEVAKVEHAVAGWRNHIGDNIQPAEVLSQQALQLEQEIAQLNPSVAEQASQQLAQTEQVLAQAKLNTQELERQLTEAQQQSAKLEGSLASVEQGLSSNEQTSANVINEISETEKQVNTLQQAEQSAKQQLDNSRTLLVTTQTQQQEYQKQLSDALSQLEATQNAWDKALDGSVFEDEQAFLQASLPLVERDKIEQTVSAYTERTSTLNGAIDTLASDLAEQQKPQIDALAEALTAAQSGYQMAAQSQSALQSQLDNFNKVKARLAELYKQNEALEAQYQVVGTLSDIANGRTGAKVSLHRFVLGVLLDDVLIQASQRLRVMSKGRYELRRKEERAKGNAGSGLDLMVEDSYSSKLRDVATLSGGESFMAALALALGLSDVVQSYSGGIRLDTLFIDEGFGSLDPESLDLAIQTLIDLQQGGRTIGLISHVSELKEQMPLRIDVKSDRAGSHIQLRGIAL